MVSGRSFWLIAPYAAWMVLMSLLPTSAANYAIRGAVTALLLAVGYFASYRRQGARLSGRQVTWGVLIGLVVLAAWLAPYPLMAKSEASPYDPAVCGWSLTLVRLAASAFVIAAAEELFFRKFLVEFAGFGWMVALFAVEHMRFDLGLVAGLAFVAEGAFCGVLYGKLAMRFGLAASIVAHVTTNFLLGLLVICHDWWQFW